MCLRLQLKDTQIKVVELFPPAVQSMLQLLLLLLLLLAIYLNYYSPTL